MNKQNVNPKQHKTKVWKIILIVVGVLLGIFVVLRIWTVLEHRAVYEPWENPSYPMVDKPIIYLYPETETDVEVKLGKPEKLTVTYPEYKNGWKVTAYPGGDLVERETGKKLYALYWEGEDDYSDVDLSEGFVVKGDEAAEFLEEKLEILGLNYKEKEEFITYWLPKMVKNEYNLVKFLTTEEINERMPIEVSVEPDTMIRVIMLMKEVDGNMEVKEQKLEKALERKGFTLVEWGGSELGK